MKFFRYKDQLEIIRILPHLLDGITTDDEYKRFEKFVIEKKWESETMVKNALETAKLNLQWSNRHIPTIKRFIQGKKSGTTSQATISCLVFLISIFIAFY